MSKPPLWEVMRAADSSCASDFTSSEARAIIAVRDRLVAEMLQLATCSCCDVMRAKVKDWLTAEADRAERGELVTALRQVSDGANACGDDGTSWITARAANLIESILFHQR